MLCLGEEKSPTLWYMQLIPRICSHISDLPCISLEHPIQAYLSNNRHLTSVQSVFVLTTFLPMCGLHVCTYVISVTEDIGRRNSLTATHPDPQQVPVCVVANIEHEVHRGHLL